MQLLKTNFLKSFLSLIVLLFCFTTWMKAQINWQQANGPSVSQITTLTANGANLFAGTNLGGAFLSTDNGANWTPINTGLTTTNVWCFAVSGMNIFAGTDAGVFLSTNNGTSWTAASSGLTTMNVWSLAVSGTNLFAGTIGGGIFLSTDNGTSWTAANSGITNATVWSIAVSGNNLLAGINGGAFLSTDNGTSWTAITGLTVNDVVAFAISGTNIFAGTNGGAFLSTNNGTSWTAINTGLSDSDIFSFAISGTNLYAGTIGSGVFLSTNNGTSWTSMSTGLTNTDINALAVSGTNLVAGTRGGGVFIRMIQTTTVPTITSFAPTSGPVGTTVTITGNNFSTTIANNIVYFGAVKATVLTATSTQLTVSIPIGATYAPITVTVNGLTAYANSPFIITFPGSDIIDATSFAPQVDFTAGINANSVVISDVDGDGKPDLVVMNSSDNTISIFRNTSNSGTLMASSFAPAVNFTTGNSPNSVAVGDIDGDGKPDLVVTNEASSTVSVFRNTSTSGSITSSSFAPKVDFTTGTTPLCVAIADLDGDGKPDLIVANNLSNSVSIFRNISTSGSITASSFASKVDLVMTGEYPIRVVISDIDGDGKPDLVVEDFSSKTFSVFKNMCSSSTISFAPKVDFTTGVDPKDIALGDIDGDGKPDVVVTNANDNSVSVFRNTSVSGSITANSFAPGVRFTTGNSPNNVAIGDVDGDGKPDLVVANVFGYTVSILKNTSVSGSITTSSFASKFDITTSPGSTPYFVSIGDVDGDGKPDLVVANSSNNSISILRNTISRSSSQTTFQKTYGGAADEDIGNIVEAPDGGYVVVGNTKSCTQTVSDLCIFKTDKSGNLQWEKSYGDSGTSTVNIAATEDGYIVAGTVQVPGNGYDILVTRTDTLGNVLWKKTFGGSLDDYGNAIYRMKNGEYVVLGYTLNYGAGGWDAFAMRITGNGDVVWFKTYGTYTTDLLNRLVEESDGSLAMTGATYISGTHNMMLLKTDSGGNLLWAKQYSFSGDESGYGIARASNGDYLIVTCAYMSFTEANVLLYRTSSEGVFRWAKIYRDSHFPGKTYFAGFDVATLPDGNILLTGEWAGASQESQCDGLFMKVDSVGTILFSKTFGGSGTDFFRKLLLTSDGGYLLGGKTNSQGNGGYDFFLVKTDANGNSGMSSNIYPVYATPVIDESDLSLTTSTYNITGQSSQFSRNGIACWKSLTLSVTSVTPLHNALNVAQNSNITATFLSNIDSSTITNSTIKINGSLSRFHPSLFKYNSNSHTLTITPNTPFKVGELVTVTLTRRIKSLTGDSLANGYCWSFTVKTNASSGIFYQSSTVKVGDTPWGVAAADFDGNGTIDMAVTNSSSGDISILKNNGSGTFTQSSLVSVGGDPRAIVALDVDGDGDMDLATANWSSNTVSILKNNGSGTFIVSSSISVGSNPCFVQAADIDGDGDLDLIVTNWSSGTVSILKNDGAGNFTISSTVNVGVNPAWVQFADFNNDGVMEFAVSNYGSGTVLIFSNNGQGTFTQTDSISVGTHPGAMNVLDVDGDGAMDLAVARVDAGTISIYKNNGSGSFSYYSDVSVGSQPASVMPADLDGDGDVDLVVSNNYSNSLSILKNNGTGTFTQSSTIAVGSYPASVVAFDMDGDGALDLAVANSQSNNLSILKNGSSSATIGVSSSLLSFRSVSVGSYSSEYLKIYNYGTDSSLIIRSITSSSPAFIVNRTSLTIAPLGCDSILVTFLPTTKGKIFNDSLILTSNDTEKPDAKVSLTGSSTVSQSKVAFTTNLNGPIYAGISLLGENAMYAIASGDAVYRMNAAGSIAYTLQVAGDIRSSSSIAYDTTVYIASSDRNLYAFSKDGNSVWSLPTGGVLTATPVIDSIANRLYIGISNHNFIAVNRLTGKVAWNYFADGEIRNSAVVTSDRKLVFATQKGTLYGFDLKNLALPATPTWQIALPDTAPSSIALDNQEYIYIGTSAGRLLKISMPSNRQPLIVWQVSLGQAIIGSPVIDAAGILYAGSLDANLYAIDIQLGSVKWAFSTKGAIRSTPAISDAGNIFVANDSGEVISLDTSKNILWYYKTSSAISAPLLYYKSTLYIGTLGNQVIALSDVIDSSQTSSLPKSEASPKITGKPVWATFQGNNQRTGTFSSSGTTGIKNSSSGLPIDYTLGQNYPNPFNPSTTIQFALPKDGMVSIKIFNMLGKNIVTLIDGYQYAGYHEVTFNMDSFSSGIYFYQMRVGSFIDTKKMILMK